MASATRARRTPKTDDLPQPPSLDPQQGEKALKTPSKRATRTKYPNGVKPTDRQRKILKQMRDAPGSFIRPHMGTSGAAMYRLMDATISPVTNYRKPIIDRMVDLGLLERAGSEVHLAPNGG